MTTIYTILAVIGAVCVLCCGGMICALCMASSIPEPKPIPSRRLKVVYRRAS